MSIYSYNYYKNLERPIVYLALPNRNFIGALHSYDLQLDLEANSADKGTFKVYRYEDSEPTKYYDDIEIGKYVLLTGIGWFKIKEISVEGSEGNEGKEITFISLEYNLSKTYLTSFGSLGTEDDEQGGLDRYCLYNPSDTEHSILHIVTSKNPAWSIFYVDPRITSEYRAFQKDSVDTYSFLMDDVSKAFDCIFRFDSFNQTIRVDKLENIGADTGIEFSYRNLIKSVTQKTDEDDVKTVLTVVGGNDSRTNTTVGINAVNGGSNSIFDYSYFLSIMSDELREKLKSYKIACDQNQTTYQNKISELKRYYEELYSLKTKVPASPGSTDWTQYGLDGLETQEKIYWSNMSLYTTEKDKALYDKNKSIHDVIVREIKKRKSEISNKESQINTAQNTLNSLVIHLQEYLGSKLYQELSLYSSEDTLTDDSFIVTDTMTDMEILEMEQALLDHGRKELAKVCYPRITSEVDLVNFTVDYDYKKLTDQLELLNIFYINLEDRNVSVPVRLLKLHVNFDDPADFKATFSNRDSLEDTWNLLEELRLQTESNASQIGFGTGAWNDAKQTSVKFKEYQNSIFDASKQQLVSSSNQEVVIDQTGILSRKWLPDQNKYDDIQLWITNRQLAMTTDSWNHVSLALGYVKSGNDYFYGLNCDKLVGRILLAEQVYIENSSGTYSISKNGQIAKNGAYEVKINPNTAADIFSISIDNKKLLYVDAKSKKLKFEGDIESISGHIASFAITDNTLVSGGVGLCSDTASGTVAFWAGNTNKNAAPFRVTNTGELDCSNIKITGGSIKIGSKFAVDNNGRVTCSDIAITGGNIAWDAIAGANEKVTTITKNTVTTSYVNALNIKAGSVDAEHITGNTIKGKTISGGTISGSKIEGGTINIGNGNFKVNSEGVVTVGEVFNANEDSVQFGDYYVSADGGNNLKSTNGWVSINTNARPSGSPGGGYASLRLSGKGYAGISLDGTGSVDCGTLHCSDVYASDCKLAEGSSRLWALGETIDWFWDEFKELRYRVDSLS